MKKYVGVPGLSNLGTGVYGASMRALRSHLGWNEDALWVFDGSALRESDLYVSLVGLACADHQLSTRLLCRQNVVNDWDPPRWRARRLSFPYSKRFMPFFKHKPADSGTFDLRRLSSHC